MGAADTSGKEGYTLSRRLGRVIKGNSLIERAARSSLLTVVGFGTYQGLRLLSNLILTRLLFPEAFGMMALVTVFLIGLSMFSDMGVAPAIMQSKRGDDPDFLDTAWTLHIIRGGILWMAASLLAYPLSLIYAEPELAWYLPVSALTLLISGFNPTKFETANRHLRTGKVILVEIATQVVGLIAAISLAWLTQSVWGLVISGVIGAIAQLVWIHVLIPGRGNRWRLEKAATHELIHFGKWIFLSTICGFLIYQGDKVILGKYLSLDRFGVYNIGYFLASFPLMLGTMIIRRVVIPVHRECPPRQSRENFLRLRKMRVFATSILLGLLLLVATLGGGLVDFLYDDRYQMAGAVVVTLACMLVPQIIVLTYDQAALAEGDSQRFFVLSAARAGTITLGMLLGVQLAGLFGALIAQGIAMIVVYPVVIWLARKQGAWDPLHDLVFFVVGGVLATAIFWFHWDDVSLLIQ